jgi:hypothetical protein
MDYAPVICIMQRERTRIPRTRGGLTPYLKKEGCAAVSLNICLQRLGERSSGGELDEATRLCGGQVLHELRGCHRPPPSAAAARARHSAAAHGLDRRRRLGDDSASGVASREGLGTVRGGRQGEIEHITLAVVERNRPLWAENDDVWIHQVISRGRSRLTQRRIRCCWI